MQENLHLELKGADRRGREFTSAAGVYASNGLDCFNTCVDYFGDDFVRGMEKRCMAGCIQNKFHLFTMYGTRYHK